MKTTKLFKHRSALSMMEKIIDECRITARGTYDRADPTSYCKGETDFTYKGGKFRFRFFDCTWAVEIFVYSLQRRDRREVELAEYCLGYDFDNQKTLSQKKGGRMLPLLARSFRYVFRPDFISRRELEAMAEPDPFGCLADYE